MMVTGILVILILIGRMFYLQIVKGSTYRRQAEGNRTRYTRILAPRGIIYDCNGEELANNKPGSWCPWCAGPTGTGKRPWNG